MANYRGNPQYLKRGGSPGRPKGIPNKNTQEVKEFCQRLLSDRIYRANLRKRLQDGTAGSIETLLWQYGYGKPKEQVENTGTLRVLVEYVGRSGDSPENDPS